eukprot:5322730-Prymnesium_polylepis.1
MYASIDPEGKGMVDFFTFAEMRVLKKSRTMDVQQQAGPEPTGSMPWTADQETKMKESAAQAQ